MVALAEKTAVATSVLVAEGITKIYRAGEIEVPALSGVNLTLSEGELVVLLGPSGSGKSTLLNILGGLEEPSAGRVLYRGVDLVGRDDAALTLYRRDHVGFVFQFYNLIPSLTARENVALVTEIARDPMEIDAVLDLVGLSDRRDHFPAQMSGGQQQRVAIARAIAKRPDILLCDEPTGALDVATGKLVLDAIARISRELGTTTVIVTHNATVGGMADRVIRFADGAVTAITTNERRASAQEMVW